MGVSLSSLAFRPPTPTYALVPDTALPNVLRFADGWTPQVGLDLQRTPIRLRAPTPSPLVATRLRARLALLSTGAPILHVTHADGEDGRLTLLYSHGTSFDLGVLRDHCVALAAALNVHVAAYDYRGYGAANSHKPSERHANEDATAALAFLTAAAVPARSIVLYGLSLGVAPTMHLAASMGADVAGVVVRSGFLSALAVAMGRAGAAMPGSPFDVGAHARRVKAPVLIIHGDLDELIGMWQAEELVRLCGGAVEPLLLEGHGHFDVERSPLFLPRLTRFLMQETRR
jgi:fermentation-respiration switch protein FrsA (DUF1100 family)